MADLSELCQQVILGHKKKFPTSRCSKRLTASGKAPPALLRAMSAMMGVLEKIVPVPEQYSSETLRVSAGATYLGNSAKAARELGFTARPLAEGLRETLEHEMHLLRIR